MTLHAEATLPPEARIEFRAKVAETRDELADPGLRLWAVDHVCGWRERAASGSGELPGGRFMELELFLVSTDRKRPRS